jgi:hypothetical protein
MLVAATKTDAGGETPASKQFGQAPTCSTPIVRAPRPGANLSDAWDGRFSSVPRRYRRMLGKLFQRSYLDKNSGRRFTSVPADDLAWSTSSSKTTAQRTTKYLVEHGVLKLASEPSRNDREHRDAKSGRFGPGNTAGSNSGRAHVFEIVVPTGQDELAGRRPGCRSMARAWGNELARYSSAAREVFAWLLAHENYGTENPDERGLAWPGVDGAECRGGGKLSERTGLSRATLYRALRELQDGHEGDGGKITRVRRPGRRSKAWRIHPAPHHGFGPGIAGISATPGQVNLRPNPGQFETRTPVNLRHEVVGSEGVDLKGGCPGASAARTEADRPSAESHTLAAPTGPDGERRGACPLPASLGEPSEQTERANEGERATAAPAPRPLSPVFQVLHAFAALAAPHVDAAEYAAERGRQIAVARALRKVTTHRSSPTGRFTPAMLIAAAIVARGHHFFGRKLRPDFVYADADRIDELLEGVQLGAQPADASKRARDADEAQRARAEQAARRPPSSPTPAAHVFALPRPTFGG